MNHQSNKPLFLSTWEHGYKANICGINLLKNDFCALDSIEEAAKITELDENVRTVGVGGYTDNAGDVTLDASIMDHNGNAGSVAFVKNISHPLSLARTVMEKSKHVMLVGEGAEIFASENGYKFTNIATDKSLIDYEKWKINKNTAPVNQDNHDTITLIALDKEGSIAAGSTTSGLAYKSKGRVGDSPIIGSGIYVDGNVGAAGATGFGEEIMKNVGSFLIVELMSQGYSPNEACREAVNRTLKKHNFKFKEQIAYIALRNDGEYGAAAANDKFFLNVSTPSKTKTIKISGCITSDA